ncbi:zf-HC2 domain-containing protein [Streptomyces sp. CYG20]|nr:zf-HC2 domain-containing protein [Streptomyces sp. COG21]MBT3079843.1 zf-HC2 domain-containing protein [Streptomyces sp. COG20]MBT3089155.1 zf-HC2 domain-containing protein [Streptomyces sp. CYG21]MBT3101030.1 zf-HC2 domain-containing protein [Streptomyces sp. CBG30]MBT3106283.1 zf-HC2 domain-containing protein [Streptomyces sp. COG19]MBT3112167.1 zf-HC2 domain-containing protein [Streptomyces sp. CYG20]
MDAELAARYAGGTATESDAWSVEKHVEACGTCAALVSSAARAVPETGPLLAGIRAAVLERVAAEGLPERAAAEARGAVDSPAYAGAPEGPAYGNAGAAASTTASPRTTASPAARASTGESPAAHAAPTTNPPADALTSTTHSAAAGATGVSPRLSRAARVLWAAGPALRGAWAVALGVVVLGALGLSYGAGLGASVRPLLLVTAPVLPLAGVALSYGRHADPLYEVVTSTPSGGLRLLLVRAAAVLGVSVPALTLAGAALPPAAGGPGAAAWLLPGLALTLAALALGSFVGSRRGAAAVGGAWALFVVAPATVGGPAGAALMAGAAPYFSGPAVQSGWAAGALACALLLAARRRSFDHLETS